MLSAFKHNFGITEKNDWGKYVGLPHTGYGLGSFK